MTCRYRDAEIIRMWLERQPSPLTRDCYKRDAGRLLEDAGKPLRALDLGDLQKFTQSLSDQGLAPISRARTIAAVKSLFGFCFRMRFIKSNPALELRMPKYEVRLAERVLSEGGLQRLLAVDCPRRPYPAESVVLRWPQSVRNMQSEMAEFATPLRQNPDHRVREERPHTGDQHPE